MNTSTEITTGVVSRLINEGGMPEAMRMAQIGINASLAVPDVPEALTFTAQYVRASRMIGSYGVGLAVGHEILADTEPGTPESAKVLVELANIYRLQRDYGQAQALLDDAMAVLEPTGDKKTMAQAIWGMGVCDRLAGDFPSAVIKLQRAQSLSEAIGDSLGNAHCRRELGVILHQTGDFPAATQQLSNALTLYEESNNGMGVAHCRRELGMLQRLQGNPQAGLYLLIEARDGFEAMDAQLGLANTYRELAMCEHALGSTVDSMRYFDNAATIYARLDDNEGMKILEAYKQSLC